MNQAISPVRTTPMVAVMKPSHKLLVMAERTALSENAVR